MKFLHLMIRVKDIEKSLQFYQKLLGLKHKRTKQLEDCNLHFLEDETTGAQIELTENFDTPKQGYTCGNSFGHLAFEVEDFSQLEEQMKKLDINWLYEPFVLKDSQGAPVGKIAFVKDPDGHEVEFIEKH